MAEEHRCQAPKLCINNCGFFGSPATRNLCSRCYGDLQLKEQQSSSAAFALNQTLASSSAAPSLSAPPTIAQSLTCEQIQPSSEIGTQGRGGGGGGDTAPVATPAKKCGRCARRVGLTGFSCRCGETFCGSHRYPEQHACEFDFKGTGKDQIAKANPVVRAEKLKKI